VVALVMFFYPAPAPAPKTAPSNSASSQ